MTSKLTREQATDSELQMLIDSREKGTAMFLRVDAYYLMAVELQERRKADSEPVAWGLFDFSNGALYNFFSSESMAEKYRNQVHQSNDSLTLEIGALYRHAQPAPSAEILRIADALEGQLWPNMTIGNREVIQAAIEALRTYPAQQPVVPEDIPDSVYEILCQACGGKAWMYEEALWNACRAAMLQAQPDDDGEPTDDERIMAIEGILPECERCGGEGWIVGEMGITRCACGQAGNSPVTPDGYVMVPADLLSELRDWAHPEIENYCEMWEGRRESEFPALRKVIADADALLAAAPQEVNHG